MSIRPAGAQRRRVAVVTGAGKGIGLATAIALAEDGATVLMWGRTLVPDALSRVRALGPASEFTLVDVSEAEVVERAVSAAISAHGALDVLVNCAGIAHSGPLEDVSPKDWDAVMGNNLRSVYLCTRAVGIHMKARRSGRIINVSSIAGRSRSSLLSCAYSTSKAAIIGFTRHVAAELAPYGVIVNCVCPGQTRTPMLEALLNPDLDEQIRSRIPLGYIARPEQIAKVIRFLASEDADYMVGAIVDVNGGVL